MTETLKDKVVLIGGATGALGIAVTREFVQTGARLALTSTSAEKLTRLVREADIPEERAFAVPVDATQEEEVNAMVEAVVDHYGRLDALVNTIGGWRGGAKVHETSVGAWGRTLDLNLRSAFLLSRAVLPHMLEHGWGRIVHVGSKSAIQPKAEQAAYVVSKMGVIRLTDVLAAEYKGTGITANVVLPSVIDTPANRETLSGMDPDRWVPPEDIAALIRFLFSDAGASISGAHLTAFGDLV